MKLSFIRGLVMFVAGAGCATVVAGFYPRSNRSLQKYFRTALRRYWAKSKRSVTMWAWPKTGASAFTPMSVPAFRRYLLRNGLPLRSISAAWNTASRLPSSST